MGLTARVPFAVAAVLGEFGFTQKKSWGSTMNGSSVRYSVRARGRRGEAQVLEILCLINSSVCVFIITLCGELGIGWVLPQTYLIHSLSSWTSGRG